MWLTLLSCFVISGWAQTPILLTDVKTLTLKAGHQTASRRGPPVPQLECVGGNCKEGKEYVEVMQCTNKGGDASGVPQWECKAELPANWRLGTTDVSCEGYLHADDPYILAGSCGVEYTLHGPPAKAPAPAPRPTYPSQQPSKVMYHVPAPAPAPAPPASSADSVPFSWGGLASAVVSIATVFLVVAAVTIGIILCIGLCSWIDSHTPRVSPRIRTVPVTPVPVYPTVPVATPVYPVAQPAGYYGGSPVVCTSSGASDFVTGYAMGHASAAAQPAAVYHAPPPRHRTPSPPRRRSPSPEPAPKHTTHISTGYGTTKRR